MSCHVSLISHTTDPTRTVVAAARLCYSEVSAIQIMDDIDDAEIGRFISILVNSGHLSPFEHAQFVFAIDGLSRVASHQLVRHRIASFSQQSQRYVTMENAQCVLPPTVKRSKEAVEIYNSQVQSAIESYNKLVAMGIPKEDARFILPHSCETRLVASMNARELRHFFNIRLCRRAQWEIQGLARKMFVLVHDIAPELFLSAGPGCLTAVGCTEVRPCGKPFESTQDLFNEDV